MDRAGHSAGKGWALPHDGIWRYPMNRMILLSTCALLSSLAFAATEEATTPDFESLDVNQDQKISAGEAAADVNVAAAFQALDADRDGALMRDEFDQSFGQTAAPTSEPPQQPRATGSYGVADSSIPGATSKEPMRSGAEHASLPSTDLQPRPEEVIGKSLIGPDGEAVAEIEHVARDPRTGDEVAVVTVGGFLGFFGKDVAVPLADLSVRADGAVHTALSEEELERLPEFAPPERG